ncbi:carboxylesterase/lipase family protein [Rubrivirga marina]|uniref:Carboxylic ester hydrolase n=1 Tax=Rubrivirga marina TaxID=1196024 RepID=A0A271IWX1_9BACT|nr:carboxylesterase family protein [Rubrivirga marina]PAP75620.1 carboxylesterase [Rubrivirga marina]
MSRTLVLGAALLLGACAPTMTTPVASDPDAPASAPSASAVVRTTAGPVRGDAEADGLRIFRGVPFAATPVGGLRWAPPQPPEAWTDVRDATAFGDRCMQADIFGDMAPRAEGMSEDCLTLNVWAPAGAESLPVLVYFYGGGFVAGDASEPRYDGAAIAREGTVVVVPNYRLGVFGFLAHPELTAASGYGGSGNYGLMDQTAALEWVRDNVAAFGGDPDQVTIAGESAGSISVSAQMVAPAARGLFHRAIGESGSALGALPPVSLDDAEAAGVRFAESVGAAALAELRAVPAADLLAAASAPGVPWFSATLDGRVYPEPPAETFAAGRQAQVPLLVGWNSEEMTWRMILGGAEPTPEAYAGAVRFLYPDHADEVLALYPGTTEAEVVESATALAGDRFIAHSTWRWFDLHRRTGGAPVYRYYYAHPRPPLRGGGASGLAGGVVEGAEAPPPATGAVHSADIEYALGNLDTHPVYAWTADDYAVSETMMGFFVRFIHTGDPNGPGLPAWPAASAAPDGTSAVMVIDVESDAIPEPDRARYELLERIAGE